LSGDFKNSFCSASETPEPSRRGDRDKWRRVARPQRNELGPLTARYLDMIRDLLKASNSRKGAPHPSV